MAKVLRRELNSWPKLRQRVAQELGRTEAELFPAEGEAVMRPDPLTEALREVVRDAVREASDEVLEELRSIAEARPTARFLTIPEAAQVANVGRTKIRDAITTGDLEAVHRGRLVRIPAEALDDWMAS